MVLLVLVVLTILGLSLVMVTQTERQIGVSEKTTQRVFSATETAMALAVSKALVLPDQRSMSLQIIEPRLPGQILNLRHDLRTSSMLPLLDAPCNLCEVNSVDRIPRIRTKRSTTDCWRKPPGAVSPAIRIRPGRSACNS